MLASRLWVQCCPFLSYPKPQYSVVRHYPSLGTVLLAAPSLDAVSVAPFHRCSVVPCSLPSVCPLSAVLLVAPFPTRNVVRRSLPTVQCCPSFSIPRCNVVLPIPSLGAVLSVPFHASAQCCLSLPSFGVVLPVLFHPSAQCCPSLFIPRCSVARFSLPTAQCFPSVSIPRCSVGRPSFFQHSVQCWPSLSIPRCSVGRPFSSLGAMLSVARPPDGVLDGISVLMTVPVTAGGRHTRWVLPGWPAPDRPASHPRIHEQKNLKVLNG